MLQQQKAQRRELADLRIGDEVLTTGNLFATVVDIETPELGSTIIVLQLAPGITVRALSGAVLQRVIPTDGDGDAGAAEQSQE